MGGHSLRQAECRQNVTNFGCYLRPRTGTKGIEKP